MLKPIMLKSPFKNFFQRVQQQRRGTYTIKDWRDKATQHLENNKRAGIDRKPCEDGCSVKCISAFYNSGGSEATQNLICKARYYFAEAGSKARPM